MILDFALMSLLLLVAHLIRARLRFLQALHLPTPILAGFLGLLLGPQGLNCWFERVQLSLPWSEDSSTYPYPLVVLLFGTLFLGHNARKTTFRETLHRSGDTFFYNLAAEIGQHGIALLFGVFVVAHVFPDLPAGFASLMPAGFAGGHGTATVFSKAFENQEVAQSVGYTFATLGLLAAMLGGIILVNIGTYCGWTRLVSSASSTSLASQQGFVPAAERESIGSQTVSASALDPLTWHVSLALVTFAVAYGVDQIVRELWAVELPLFALATVAGALLQKILNVVGVGSYIDRKVMARVGSTAADYLIAFAVATIRIDVVVEYAAPIALLAGVGIVYSVALLWLMGRKMFHNYWFERSLFTYGWCTGIVGYGIALLRIVDPQFRTRTAEDYGLSYVFIAPVIIVLLTVLPPLVTGGSSLACGIVLTSIFLVCIVCSRWLVGWFPHPPNQPRADEDSSP